MIKSHNNNNRQTTTILITIKIIIHFHHSLESKYMKLGQLKHNCKIIVSRLSLSLGKVEINGGSMGMRGLKIHVGILLKRLRIS
jgi:hypothetical protein